MDFIADNAVALSAILLGVLVLIGLIALVVTGVRLWRSVTAAKDRVTIAGELLRSETERMQAALAALPERQAELQGEIASLQRRAAVLAVLARHAGEAADTLRAPLRYIGR